MLIHTPFVSSACQVVTNKSTLIDLFPSPAVATLTPVSRATPQGDQADAMKLNVSLIATNRSLGTCDMIIVSYAKSVTGNEVYES